MPFKVRADYYQAISLVEYREGITFSIRPSDEELSEMIRDIIVSEKGYPSDTIVEIDGSDPMDMVLQVDSDGSWELV